MLGVGDLQGAAGLPLEEGEELEWGGSAAKGPGATLGEPLLEIPSFLQSPGQALPVGRHVAEGNKRVAERGA